MATKREVLLIPEAVWLKNDPLLPTGYTPLRGATNVLVRIWLKVLTGTDITFSLYGRDGARDAGETLLVQTNTLTAPGLTLLQVGRSLWGVAPESLQMAIATDLILRATGSFTSARYLVTLLLQEDD